MGAVKHRRHGVTLTELLVVIAGIAILMGLLFPALAGFRRQALMAESMSNLRQIATWMRLYSGENREFIVPSQFNYDYDDDQYSGKVRAPIGPTGNLVPPVQGERHKGTWADILWTVNELGPLPEMVTEAGHGYRFDSPDVGVYKYLPSYTGSVLRSAASNSGDFSPIDSPGDGVAKPYGDGAHEASLPGFFAANNFFNADAVSPTFNDAPGSQNGFWTMGQIRAPHRSMYLVDSFAGEIIEADPAPFQVDPLPPTATRERPATGWPSPMETERTKRRCPASSPPTTSSMPTRTRRRSTMPPAPRTDSGRRARSRPRTVRCTWSTRLRARPSRTTRSRSRWRCLPDRWVSVRR